MAVPARRLPAQRRPAGGGVRPRPATSRREPRSAAPARRQRTVPFLLMFLLVAGLMVTGLVTTQALVAQGSFRIQELTERLDRLRSDYGRLQLRHAELSNPGRIEAWAERAGLVPNEGLEVLTVAPERSGPVRAGEVVVARGPRG